MCGIAGMIDWRAATSADALRSIGEAMIETVRHRGPDAGAVWVEAESGAALGQRRLAIIDLSPSGAQPMHSADRRYVITFNGEIYNYRDIRRELQAAGRSMRGESDTEVLLEACALWGVEAAIERAIGMFAFALWDRKTLSLTLARDRLGIKPCRASCFFPKHKVGNPTHAWCIGKAARNGGWRCDSPLPPYAC